MNLISVQRSGQAMPQSPRPPFTERGMLRLFVRGDSFFANLRDCVITLASRPTVSYSRPARYFRGADFAQDRWSGRSVGASFLLHCAFVALLIYLPQVMLDAPPSTLSAQERLEVIYYRLPVLPAAKIPRLAPAGPGGQPGSGFIPNRPPVLGSTAPHPTITMFLKPIHPDNHRQTIYQASSPPELKITTELKLPNIVLFHMQKSPEAPAVPRLSKPIVPNRHVVAMDSPSVNTNPVNPLMPVLPPSQTQPSLPIPLAGMGAPVRASNEGSSRFPGNPPGDAPDLLVLGVDPGIATDALSLPAGGRWGEFSVGPHGGVPGSPGGDPAGVVGGGSGGGTSGGDASTGVGGIGVGGGGNLGAGIPVSIAGTGVGGGPGGLLGSVLPASLVYAVKAPVIRARRNALVISAGPLGGGGLNVYGALKCGRIYSIFLPMPGANWTLQYCDMSDNSKNTTFRGNASVVHLDKPLLPPDFDQAHRFDFRRVRVPIEKSHRSIILKGVISAEGTVQHLFVYQGVVPEMDEAARIAFSRWRFKPALKDGKPVDIEILVGIPPHPEGKPNNH